MLGTEGNHKVFYEGEHVGNMHNPLSQWQPIPLQSRSFSLVKLQEKKENRLLTVIAINHKHFYGNGYFQRQFLFVYELSTTSDSVKTGLPCLLSRGSSDFI